VQTWPEVHEANADIRERMKAERKLGKSRNLAAWQSVDLSEAQRQDARFYTPDAKVCFVRKYGRFEAGDACEIAGVNQRGVLLRKDGRTTLVSFRNADRFIVAKEREMEVARGDRLQMKFNGKSVEGSTIRNGELVTVQRVMKNGRIAVRDDNGVLKTLNPNQRHFVHGYAVTSYSSQGKTVDIVFASYAGEPLPANRNQWYVAISRGKKNVIVLTENKEALRMFVEQETNRELALSLELDIGKISPACRAFPLDVQKDVALVQWMKSQAALKNWFNRKRPVPQAAIPRRVQEQLARIEAMFSPQHKPSKGVKP